MQSTVKPLALLVAAACAAPEIYAQSLEEVVVSARKRNETLEDAPISVRAFTEAEIASAGISTPGKEWGTLARRHQTSVSIPSNIVTNFG